MRLIQGPVLWLFVFLLCVLGQSQPPDLDQSDLDSEIPTQVQTVRLAYYDLGQRVDRAIHVQLGDLARLELERDHIVQFQSALTDVRSLFFSKCFTHTCY
jgi:hypothetical protein